MTVGRALSEMIIPNRKKSINQTLKQKKTWLQKNLMVSGAQGFYLLKKNKREEVQMEFRRISGTGQD